MATHDCKGLKQFYYHRILKVTTKSNNNRLNADRQNPILDDLLMAHRVRESVVARQGDSAVPFPVSR